MDHVAIMKKEWGFIEKVLSGHKTIESRWYKNKSKPWDIIKKGDTVYFKNSGESVSVKSRVKKVIQFFDLTPKKVGEILKGYGTGIGIDTSFATRYGLANKKYCILIFLKNPQKVKPFHINKEGFGTMASWITINDINKIKYSLT